MTKTYTVFDVLDVINCFSLNWDLCTIDLGEYAHCEQSKLLKVWKILWRMSPNIYNIEKLFSKLFAGNITIGNLTISGCNKMMFNFELKTNTGLWWFQPPCVNLFWHRFTWGRLCFLPDGIIKHPNRVIYYNHDVCKCRFD